jgi:FixJ family two-component response regulator
MIGTDLARALRRKQSATATLIISGYTDVQGVPMEFPRLTKPFRQAELVEAIHSVLIPDTADPQIASGSA